MIILDLLKIVQKENKRFIETYTNAKKQNGNLIPTSKVWLKVISKDNGYQFYYSFDGKLFEQVGERFELKDWCNWRGAEAGLFCWNDESATGFC